MLCPIQLNSNLNHLSVDELLQFETKKIDLQTALSKFKTTLTASGRTLDEIADEALDFIYESWKWYKLDIEP